MLARDRPEGSPLIPKSNTGQQNIGRVLVTSSPTGLPRSSSGDTGTATIPTLLGGNVPIANSQRCAGETGTPELNPLAYLCSHKKPSEAVAQAVCHQLFGKTDCDAAMKSLKTDVDSACKQYEVQKNEAKNDTQKTAIEDAIHDLAKKNEEKVINCVKGKVGNEEDLLQYLETSQGQKTINECKKKVDSSLTPKANQKDTVGSSDQALHDVPAPSTQMNITPFAKSPSGITTIVLATALGGFFIYMGARIVVRLRA
tara:strand:+ start:159 stop:926 length:768 start_codon:yes stop_codon:yes gene_type:complete